MKETQFKRRTHDAVANTRRKFAQIQPLGARLGRAQQPREALALQVRGAQQISFRPDQFGARLDDKHGRPGGHGR